MRISNTWAIVLVAAIPLTLAAPQTSLALNESTHRLVNIEAANSSQSSAP